MAVLDKPKVVDDRHTRLNQWGSSRAVRIPKTVCMATGIDTGSNLTMESGTDEVGPYILLRPAKPNHRSYADAPYISLDELFEDYEGDYTPHEADWGLDVGAEAIA